MLSEASHQVLLKRIYGLEEVFLKNNKVAVKFLVIFDF